MIENINVTPNSEFKETAAPQAAAPTLAEKIEARAALIRAAHGFNAVEPRIQNLATVLCGGTLPQVRPQFAAILRILPRDLSGFDLTLAYEQAENSDEERLLKDLELTWKPTLKQALASEFPGPIGEMHGANNLRCWQSAKKSAAAQFKEAMERDIRTVGERQHDVPLVKAVHELMRLAFALDGDETSAISPFTECGAQDAAANLAGLRIMRAALDELDKMCALYIEHEREWLREELSALDEIASEVE